jgi:hypothetical protein
MGENEFDRLHKRLDMLTEHVTGCRVDIGKLEVKSSIWGFAGGMLAMIAVWLKSIFLKV